MNSHVIRIVKKLVRPLLAAIIASVVPLCPLALADLKDTPTQQQAGSSSYQTQEFSGTVIARGEIAINGNEAPSGTTVFTKSTVATGPTGSAVIDLGPIGRIELGPNTNVLLTFTGEMITVAPGCERLTVRVIQGEVEARLDSGARLLPEGAKINLAGVSELAAHKGSIFFLDCSSSRSRTADGGGAASSGPTIGIVGAVGAAVAATAINRSASSRSPKVSPVLP